METNRVIKTKDMKTVDQILDNVMCCTIEEEAEDVKENYYYRHNDVVKAIEQAQIEAYDQALDDKLDVNKIHVMLSGIKIDNDNLDYIKLTGEICGNLRWDLVEAIKNLKK